MDYPIWYKFLSRKFLLCLGCGVVCTILLFFGKLDSTIYRDLILGTIGVYVAGNASQKIWVKKDENKTAG